MSKNIKLNSGFSFNIKQVALFAILISAIGVLAAVLAFLVGFELFSVEETRNTPYVTSQKEEIKEVKTVETKDLEVISPKELIQELKERNEVDYTFYEKLKKVKNEDREKSLEHRINNSEKEEPLAIEKDTQSKPDLDNSEQQAIKEDTSKFSGKGFTIQVNSFKDKNQADKAVSKLKEKGYTAYIMKKYIDESGLWYRVRVGQFVTREEAEKYAALLKNSENLQPYVTSSDQ
ncbi:MAG: SPOR domain-containing protein [Pseudomonadota bacterium]